MIYNIHPIIVHFPIAFLLLFSVIKILPLSKWLHNVSLVSWKHVERVLLFCGVLGVVAAMLSGGLAEDLVKPNQDLVDAHSTFAFFSFLVYGILLAGEIVSNYKVKFEPYTSGLISKILAILGLIFISVTGILGGVMIYGTSADPFAAIILKILGINL